eukprot:GFUD01020964.1.p1 GENE.GFUD01020964.1~~GFUD01020964.1.p1  ORF type:complete len:436 (-),score=82.40 GFUD01020964.1:28-1335(-)
MTTYQLLEDLRRNVVDLDSNEYKVMVIWDHVSNKDVGWLTVKKDVVVDFSKFQGRDVNLQALLSSKPVRSSPTFSPRIDSSDHDTEQPAFESSISTKGSTNLTDDTTQEVIDIGDDSTDDDPEGVNMDMNENFDSTNTEQNLLFSSQSCSKIMPAALEPEHDQKQKNWRAHVKRQCPQCPELLSNSVFMVHLRSAHNLQPEKEEVTCDICGIPLFKVNLEFHKSTSHFVKKEPRVSPNSNKLNCPCGKQYSTIAGLTQHTLRYCGKQAVEKSTKKFNCPCGKKYNTISGLKQHTLRFCGKQSKNGGLDRINELRRQNKMVDNKELKNSSRENIEKQTGPGQKAVLSLGDKSDSTARESSLNRSTIRKEKVQFKIVYQGKSYDCSRNKRHTIQRSLSKFCKDLIGKELRFEFQGKTLTGKEGVEDFVGGKIVALDV